METAVKRLGRGAYQTGTGGGVRGGSLEFSETLLDSHFTDFYSKICKRGLISTLLIRSRHLSDK